MDHNKYFTFRIHRQKPDKGGHEEDDPNTLQQDNLNAPVDAPRFNEPEPTPATIDTKASGISTIHIYDDIKAGYKNVPETDHQYLDLGSVVDSETITMQLVEVQGVMPKPTHTTTKRIDAHQTNVEQLELSQGVPEASIDEQYLYDDTALPAGDMASASYTNDDKGDTYEQLSKERKCQENPYADLESPEGSDYEECVIVTK